MPEKLSHSSGKSRTSRKQAGRSPRRSRRVVRWVLIVLAVFFFWLVLREAMDPFGDKGYTEISHGNHSHYVPEDRDPNAPLDQFPMRAPGPNERILPDGRVVPK